jgi:outer membrane protein TolC
MKIFPICLISFLFSSALVFADGSTLTLEKAVIRGLSVSKKIQMSQTDLQSQKDKKREAYAGAGPIAKIDYTKVRYDRAQIAQVPGLGNLVLRPDTASTGSLVVAQPITGFFAYYEKGSFESGMEGIQESVVLATEVEIAFGVYTAYRRAQQAERMVTISESTIVAMDSQKNNAEALQRAGKLTKGDLLKIDIASLDARANKAQAVSQKTVAMETLRQLLDLPVGEDLKLEDLVIDGKGDAKAIPNTNEAKEKAFNNRLDLSIAKSTKESFSSLKKLSYVRFAPDVNVFFRWDRTFDQQAVALPAPKDVKSVGLQVSWQLWDNGSKIFAHRQTEAQIEKAETAEFDLRDKIELEVYQNVAQLKALQETLTLRKVGVSQAEESYRIENAKFEQGSTTVTELLLSQAALNRAQGGLIAAVVDMDIQWMQLLKAQGERRPIVSQSGSTKG